MAKSLQLQKTKFSFNLYGFDLFPYKMNFPTNPFIANSTVGAYSCTPLRKSKINVVYDYFVRDFSESVVHVFVYLSPLLRMTSQLRLTVYHRLCASVVNPLFEYTAKDTTK